jgi:regulatory protein
MAFLYVGYGERCTMTGGIISALEIQKRNKERVNVYLDGEYAFSLTLDEAARLHKGDTLSDEQIASLKTEDDVQRAVERALNFLSYRPRSAHEVRRNLLDKDVTEPAVDAALERLTKLGYLDDMAFAALWVRDRNNFKPISPKALRHELRQKGIAESVIAEVLESVDVDDVAFRAAQSQVRRWRGSSRREFRDKLLAFLQRRGFSYGDAKDALRRLEADLETDEQYFAPEEGDERDPILPPADD